MECPDDEEVREAFNVLESGFKFGPYLESAFHVVFRAQSLRNLFCVLVRASDVPDRFH
jgi:hypothetical protein